MDGMDWTQAQNTVARAAKAAEAAWNALDRNFTRRDGTARFGPVEERERRAELARQEREIERDYNERVAEVEEWTRERARRTEQLIEDLQRLGDDASTVLTPAELAQVKDLAFLEADAQRFSLSILAAHARLVVDQGDRVRGFVLRRGIRQRLAREHASTTPAAQDLRAALGELDRMLADPDRERRLQGLQGTLEAARELGSKIRKTRMDVWGRDRLRAEMATRIPSRI